MLKEYFRLFMTYQTERNRVFDTKKILAVSTAFLIFNYTFHLLSSGLVVLFELPGAITSCAGIPAKGFPWVIAFKFLYNLGVILVGISSDLALHRYVCKL